MLNVVVPSGQRVHAGEPGAGANVPTSHLPHAAAEVLPVKGLDVPKEHGKQELLELLPTMGLYVPAGQSTAMPLAQNEPAGQVVQDGAPLPLNVPAAQAEQEGAPLPLNHPAPHAAQAALVVPPVLGLAVPAAHGEQEGWPSAGWYEPAAQLAQEKAPLPL